VPDSFAFEESLRSGAFVAAGDVNGDGFADLALEPVMHLFRVRAI
jgi:hypothetical protein